MGSDRVVRIQLVRFSRGEGPMSGYQLCEENGEPVGAGLFKTPELARAHANQQAWTVIVEEPARG